MIIDEARTKLCIFDIFAPENFDAYCVADKCMAWRWHEEFVTDHLCETFLNEDSRLEYKSRPVRSKTSGYCGLAGKEGAE